MDFSIPLRPSKHFRNKWMWRWDWDIHDLRTALEETYKLEKVGKVKYEAQTCYKGKKKGDSKKIIFVHYGDEIFIISGAEGEK